MYRYFYGVKQDDAKAAYWFEKAAKQGHADAAYELGYMYRYGVKQDDAKAAYWFEKAAKQGDAYAAYELGYMYRDGEGVKQDDAKAAYWFEKVDKQDFMYVYAEAALNFLKVKEKALKTGDVEAQYQLGYMYRYGKGIKKDYAKAIYWFEKAAKQGHAYAAYQLGAMYEEGRGVAQDNKQAVAWYRKAVEQGNAKAQRSLKLLLEKIARNTCTGSTKLFGVAIKCANRDTLMAAVKKAGAKVKIESKKKWGDIYYTSNILKGSSELYIGYTVDDWFAYAEYTFPSYVDSQQIVKIKDMVASKYGAPDSKNGNPKVGRASYIWQLKDGIVLKVSRGWPSTTTYLRYIYPKNYKAMQDEIERQRKAREREEALSQSNAF